MKEQPTQQQQPQELYPTFLEYFDVKARPGIVNLEEYRDETGEMITDETVRLKTSINYMTEIIKHRAKIIKWLDEQGRDTRTHELEFERLFFIYQTLQMFSAGLPDFLVRMAAFQNTTIAQMAGDNFKMSTTIRVLLEALEESEQTHRAITDAVTAILTTKKNKDETHN